MPPLELLMVATGQIPIEPDDTRQFLKLPGEIRNEIYSYLVPDLNHVYSAELRLSPCGTPKWRLFWEPESDGQDQEEDGQPGHEMTTCMELLTLNKQISIEARGLLYGPYAKEILTSGNQQEPTDAHIFSLFGSIDKLHHLQLELEFGILDHVAIKSLRQRVECFVDNVLRSPSGAGQILRLEQLIIQFPSAPENPTRTSASIWGERKYMFCVEDLSRLRSSNTLTVTMDPAWLGKCLTLCVREDGVPLRKAEWVQIAKYPTARSHRRTKTVVTSKQYWYPEFNWGLFARSNNTLLVPYGRHSHHSQWMRDLKR